MQLKGLVHLKTNDREVRRLTTFTKEAWESVPYVRREGVAQTLDSMANTSSKSSKLNLDTLNTIIQELEKEGFIKELYPDGLKR